MRIEVLVALLETPRTGKPCGARTSAGPCQTNGFAPCGRCHEHGAVAMQGIKRPRNKAERLAVHRRLKDAIAKIYGPQIEELDAAMRRRNLEILGCAGEA